MRHFFILSHLGVDIQLWNKMLTTNKFLYSHFVYNDLNTYYNSNIYFDYEKYETKFSKHFDILVFNWQTGFKDALSFSKVIYIENNSDDCIQRVKDSGLIHRMCAKDYLDNRKEFIRQQLPQALSYIKIQDDLEKLQVNLQRISDFVQVPMNFQFTLSK